MSITTTPLGTDLYHIKSAFQGALFDVGEGMQLATEAFSMVASHVAGSPQEEWVFHYPIGLRPTGDIIRSSPSNWKKDRLHSRFVRMRDQDLPVAIMYQLVTLTEAWLQQVLRRVLRQFPQKLGQKKMVPVSFILAAKTIESAHIAATDSFLHELSYKAPKEIGEIASEILSIDILAMPAFGRFVEVKATRDIWIHNLGTANDIYIQKAGSHARVKPGQHLPVTVQYLLGAYETCIQLLEATHEYLEQLWPPPPEASAPLFEGTATESASEGESKSTDDTSAAEPSTPP